MDTDLTIRISESAAAVLRERAAQTGESLAEYAAGIVERTAEGSPLELRDVSGPVADDFGASGMTDDELGDFLEEVKHKVRAAPPDRNHTTP